MDMNFLMDMNVQKLPYKVKIMIMKKIGESFHTKTKKLSNGYKFLRLFLFYTSQK